jgi:hypothetical protein
VATPQALLFQTGPGIGTTYLATFDPSTATISLSNAGDSVSGSPTYSWDWFDGTVWTTVASIVNGSQINSGINAAGSTIHTGTVHGLRPNFSGAWTGTVKICIQY